MNLADWLERIQRKPHQERLKLLWVCVSISMFIVFCFWLVSLNSLIKGGGSETQSAQSQQALDSANKSYQQMKSQVPTLWQTLKASILGSASQPAEDSKASQPKTNSIFKDQTSSSTNSGQE